MNLFYAKNYISSILELKRNEIVRQRMGARAILVWYLKYPEVRCKNNLFDVSLCKFSKLCDVARSYERNVSKHDLSLSIIALHIRL